MFVYKYPYAGVPRYASFSICLMPCQKLLVILRQTLSIYI